MTPVGARIARDSSRTLGCNTLCWDTSRTKFAATIIWDRRTNLDLAHTLEGSHRLRHSGPSEDYHSNKSSTKQCDQHNDDRAPWDPTKMYVAMPSNETSKMNSSAMNGITSSWKNAKHCKVCVTNHANPSAQWRRSKGRLLSSTLTAKPWFA
jgi:hypothetical protein